MHNTAHATNQTYVAKCIKLKLKARKKKSMNQNKTKKKIVPKFRPVWPE